MANSLKIHRTLSLIILLLGSWLSSGTLAPYAVTLPETYIRWSPEGYPLNLDHEHFAQVDLMVGGYPSENWKHSHYLRRVLYSVAARPLTAVFGFLYGGVIFNLLLTALCFLIYARFLTTFARPGVVPWGLWLLATYPGISYWVGLPYHHASIVPLCLWQYILLHKMHQRASLSGIFVCSIFLCLGILGLSYDLLPIFIPLAIMILVEKKLWRWILPGVILAVLPGWIVSWGLSYFVDPENPNSSIIRTIVKSYLNWPSAETWVLNLQQLPRLFLLNFMDSNFWTLPLVATIFLLAKPRIALQASCRVACYMSLTMIGLFVFNNMAPPYPGWQMRGEWIARLYQPFFVPLIFFILSILNKFEKPGQNRWASMLLAAGIGAQSLVVFGGALGLPQLANVAYHRFYLHSPSPMYTRNLEKLGVYPLGIPPRADKKLTQTPQDRSL